MSISKRRMKIKAGRNNWHIPSTTIEPENGNGRAHAFGCMTLRIRLNRLADSEEAYRQHFDAEPHPTTMKLMDDCRQIEALERAVSANEPIHPLPEAIELDQLRAAYEEKLGHPIMDGLWQRSSAICQIDTIREALAMNRRRWVLECGFDLFEEMNEMRPFLIEAGVNPEEIKIAGAAKIWLAPLEWIDDGSTKRCLVPDRRSGDYR